MCWSGKESVRREINGTKWKNPFQAPINLIRFECVEEAVSRRILRVLNKRKLISKQQEKEIHQVLKEEHVMVCSSPFLEVSKNARTCKRLG